MNLEFVPCNVHPDLPAINMIVSDEGVPVFECIDCIKKEVEV